MIQSKYELEAMARLTLGKICNYPIGTLKCADRPDLQDEVRSYGIEVVEDCYPNEKKAERIFDEVWNIPYSDIATKKLAKFEEAGGKLEVEDNKIVGGLLGKSDNDPNHLIGVIRDKIKKLNGGGYAKFNTYELYVYVSTTYLWDSYVRSVIDEVSRIESKLKYKTIYLDIGFEMCICDMDSKTYERNAIDHESRKWIDERL